MTLAQSLLGFTALAAVVAVTPGLDTVLVEMRDGLSLTACCYWLAVASS